MYKFAMTLFITLGVSLMTNNLSANSAVPLQYTLKEISISLLHQTGHGIPGGYEIIINGGANSFYSRNKETQNPISIDNKTLLELVNDFYSSHFFELADTYTVKKQVILKNDGSVVTTSMRLMDIASTRLCIQLADYKKCLTIVNGQPVEVAQLITKIENLFMH